MRALLLTLIAILALLPPTCFAQFGGFQAFDLPFSTPIGNYAILGDHIVFNGSSFGGLPGKVLNLNVDSRKVSICPIPWPASRILSSNSLIVAIPYGGYQVVFIDPLSNQTTVVDLKDGLGFQQPVLAFSLPAVTDTSLSYFCHNQGGVLKFAKYSRHTNQSVVTTIDSVPGATYSFSNSPNQLFYFRRHTDTTLFEVDLEGRKSLIGKTKFIQPFYSNDGIYNLVKDDTTIWAQELHDDNDPMFRLYRFDKLSQIFITDTIGLQSQYGFMSYRNNEIAYLTYHGLYKRLGSTWALAAPFIDSSAECYFDVRGMNYFIGGYPNNLYQKVGLDWIPYPFPNILKPFTGTFHLNPRYLFFPSQHLSFDLGDHYFKINRPIVGNDELETNSTSFYEDIWFARNSFNSYYSTDLGTTWTPVTVASTTRRLMAVNSRLGQSDSLLSVYYAAPQTTRLALSTDKGRTWRAKSFIGVPTWGGSTLFTVGSRIFLYNRDKIYRAENTNSPFVTTFVDTLKNLKVIGHGDSIGIVADGYSASSVDGGITYVRASLPATGPFRSPTHHFGAYWVVQSGRLYRSTDQMQTWQQIWTPADSLPINIYNFQGVNQIGFADSMLFVFGFGGSYRAKFNPDIVTGLDWQTLARPDEERLVVYPNPSNAATELNFRLEPALLGQQLTISLRDAVGKTWAEQQSIATEVNTQSTKGLPLGIYSLVVRWLGGQRQTKVVISQ